MTRWIAVVVFSLTLAGCGGGGGSASSTQGPKTAAVDFAHAIGAGDVAQACSLMTAKLRQNFIASAKARTCPAAWKKALANASAADKKRFRNAKVNRVIVYGSTATLHYVGERLGTPPTHLRKVGGKWLVDAATKS